MQDHRRQIGTLDFRVGKFGSSKKVLLGVQANTNTRLYPATTPLPLVRAGLRYRLNGQTLHFGAIAVAADAGFAGIDHIADPGDGQGSLCHVGRQHRANTLPA